MKELFSVKIENIHNNLMECYRDSSNYSSTITGQERENFQKNLLTEILPSNYRIGSGTITDVNGKETGQIDTIIELPFSISFPISTGITRLYLADTVGATFEIKSNLYQKWDEAINKIKEIKKINRYDTKNKKYNLLDDLKIPSFIIAYKGHKSIETLYKKLDSIEKRYWPNGIYIIESGIFLGLYGGDGVLECTGKKESTLGFISYLYQVLQRYAQKEIDLYPYSKLLK